MQIAITGGTGFIGKHLTDAHISRGDQVRVLTRKKNVCDNRIEYIEGDLRHSDLDRFVQNADVLYHCAAELKNEAMMHALHVEGMMRLLCAAKGKIGRWVQLSSVGVYKKIKTGHVDEKTEIDPIGFYEKTKAEADSNLIFFAQKNNLDYVILRPSNVFGVGMKSESLARLIKLIKKKLFVHVGKKESIVNYVLVDDVVNALIACATQEKALCQVYNLSQTTQTKKMIEAFAASCGVTAPRYYFPEGLLRALTWFFSRIPDFPLTRGQVDALTGGVFFDSEKIQEELGFVFQRELTKSLADYSQKI